MKLALTMACALALIASAPHAYAQATCTATGFTFNGSPNLTAALINPPGTVSGEVNATGCDIGIYYSSSVQGQVSDADVFGTDYFGIVNNGANVNIENSTISNIYPTPLSGVEQGFGIFWVPQSGATGTIQGNYIFEYQKDGIAVRGPNASATIKGNTVIGFGPYNAIAQNGIEVGLGAKADIVGNVIVGNSYTGPNEAAAGGLLVYGGACYGGPATTNIVVTRNTGFGNDIGVWFTNLDADCNTLTSPTKNDATFNTLINNAITNTSGDVTEGYQAGISDQGDMDSILHNVTCGLGYTPPGTAAAAVFAIDLTAAINPVVSGNTICTTGVSPASPSANVAAPNRAHALKAAP